MRVEIPEHRKPWSIYADELPDYGDSTKVPSVSGVIAWKYGGPPDVPNVHIAMDRGSKIHACLHYLDERDLYWPSVAKSEEMRQYVLAWQAWLKPSDEWLAIERPLYGELCGIPFIVKPDRVLKRDGRTYVIDIKTKSKSGRPPTEDERLKHGLAAAAQTAAIQQRMPYVAVNWQGCAYLWPNRECQLIGYNDPKLMDRFAEILCEWKAAQHEEEGRPSREEDLASHA